MTPERAADACDLRFHDLCVTGATLLGRAGATATAAELMTFLRGSTPCSPALRTCHQISDGRALIDMLSDVAIPADWWGR